MENAQKLFVFSERRYGKTSLVRAALGKLPRKGYLCAYVDLWPTDTEAAFATAVAKAITESMEPVGEQAVGDGEEVFRQALAQRHSGRGRQTDSERLAWPGRPGRARRWTGC